MLHQGSAPASPVPTAVAACVRRFCRSVAAPRGTCCVAVRACAPERRGATQTRGARGGAAVAARAHLVCGHAAVLLAVGLGLAWGARGEWEGGGREEKPDEGYAGPPAYLIQPARPLRRLAPPCTSSNSPRPPHSTPHTTSHPPTLSRSSRRRSDELTRSRISLARCRTFTPVQTCGCSFNVRQASSRAASPRGRREARAARKRLAATHHQHAKPPR